VRRNPLVVGLIAATALLLFAFVIVFPQGGRVEQAERDLVAAEEELSGLQDEVSALEAFAASGAGPASLAAIQEQLPTQSDLPELFETLREAARVAEVELAGISPGVPVVAPSGSASIIPLGITVEGSYFSLASFLFELEHLDRLARVNGVSITPQSDGGRLSMQLSAEVYTTDTNAGPGTDPAPGEDLG
jgi:Tfp pilus assembly protein PilO